MAGRVSKGAEQGAVSQDAGARVAGLGGALECEAHHVGPFSGPDLHGARVKAVDEEGVGGGQGRHELKVFLGVARDVLGPLHGSPYGALGEVGGLRPSFTSAEVCFHGHGAAPAGDVLRDAVV